MSSREPQRSYFTALVVVALGLLAAIVGWIVSGGTRVAAPGATAGAAPSAEPAAVKRTNARPMRAGSPRRPLELSSAEATAVESGIGAFEGRVISSTSMQGIPGARLVWAGRDEDFSVTTDASGGFRFEPPEEGTYTIASVAKRGFFSRDPDAPPLVVIASIGSGLRGIEIALDPEVHYRGLVVSPAGEPVAGARVRMLDAAGSGAQWTTDRDGRFDAVAADDALLEATHAEYAAGRARIDLAAQISKTVTIALRDRSEAKQSARISGVVRTRRGDPVDSALVIATHDGAGARGDTSPVGRATTNARGEFVVEGLDAGPHNLTAAKEGLARASAYAVVAPATAVVLEMSTGGSIAGSVRRASTGDPVAAFTIVLRQSTGPLTEEVVTAEPFFDDKGEFVVTAVPGGSYTVTALASGLAPSAKVAATVVDDARDPTVVDLELPDGGRVAGTVRSGEGGPPLAGARVTLEGQSLSKEDGIPYVASAVTDASGAFTLSGVALGTTTLFITAEQHHARIIANVGVPSSINVALTPLGDGETPKIELFGIGAMLKAADDALVVQGVVPGGGADKAGLSAGDAIVAVDGDLVTTLGFADAVQRIRGPEGTVVELTIRPASGGKQKVVPVTRVRIRA